MALPLNNINAWQTFAVIPYCISWTEVLSLRLIPNMTTLQPPLHSDACNKYELLVELNIMLKKLNIHPLDGRIFHEMSLTIQKCATNITAQVDSLECLLSHQILNDEIFGTERYTKKHKGRSFPIDILDDPIDIYVCDSRNVID